MAATVLPISLGPGEVARFTPSAYDSATERPVFLLADTTPELEARLQRAVTERGAVSVTQERIRSFLRDAVNALLEGVAKQDALDDLDQIILGEQRVTAGEELSEEDKVEFVKLQIRVAELSSWACVNWPPFAQLNGQLEFAIATRVDRAAKIFLRGWEGARDREGAEVGYMVGRDGLVTDAALNRLRRGDLWDVGLHALSRMRIGQERKKN